MWIVRRYWWNNALSQMKMMLHNLAQNQVVKKAAEAYYRAIVSYLEIEKAQNRKGEYFVFSFLFMAYKVFRKAICNKILAVFVCGCCRPIQPNKCPEMHVFHRINFCFGIQIPSW